MTDTSEFLAHFGVKGMKWGVRNGKRIGANSSVLEAHEDAVKAQTAKDKVRVSGTHALSNKELQELVTRQNLEQQYARLNPERVSAGRSFAKTVQQIGVNSAKNSVQNKTTNALSKGIDIATDQAVKAAIKQIQKKTK